MKCKNCQSEIMDGALFCPNCGAKQKRGKNPYLLKYIVPISVIAAFSIAGVLAFCLFTEKDEQQREVADWQGILVENASEEAETEEIYRTTGEEETEETEEPQLFVTVPAEYLKLRTSAGLEDDVIGEIGPGILVEWYGEMETVNERNYLKIRVKDTLEEGFLPELFLTPVQFLYDKDELTIVDTAKQLYSYDEMVLDLHELEQKYGDYLEVNVIGYSLDGREIYEAVLGNPEADNHILIQAAMHGREYITSQLSMKLLEYYLRYMHEGIYNGISYEELFQKAAIHVVPMTNPDGVSISQYGENGIRNDAYKLIMRESYFRDKELLEYRQNTNDDWYWFDGWKTPGFIRNAEETPEITYEQYLTIWKANAQGVDLNKNFNAFWEPTESRELPAYANFKGFFSESEPETQALVNLANSYPFLCYISYHSMGQLMYYDMSFQEEGDETLSEILVTMLSELNRYALVPTRDLEEQKAGGGFGDWVPFVKQKANVTIEMGKAPCPVPISEFAGMFERNRETWAMLCHELYYK